METTQPQRTDRFTPLLIFCSDTFSEFAAEMLINFKPIIGYSNSLIEPGFVVNAKHKRLILASCVLEDQDTVLFLRPQEAVYGGYRHAYLVDVVDHGHEFGSASVYVGNWCQVSTEEALLSEAWTCYPQTNTFYITKMLASDPLDV